MGVVPSPFCSLCASVFQVRMLLFAFCVNNFELYGLNNTAVFLPPSGQLEKQKKTQENKRKYVFSCFCFVS